MGTKNRRDPPAVVSIVFCKLLDEAQNIDFAPINALAYVSQRCLIDCAKFADKLAPEFDKLGNCKITVAPEVVP
jgi:hypothetical protein